MPHGRQRQHFADPEGVARRQDRPPQTGGDRVPVSALVDGLVDKGTLIVCLLVPLLVFAEDALFVGFLLPGETAAVIGGVVASQGHVDLWAMLALVVGAAILGDSVGYQIGRRFGSALPSGARSCFSLVRSEPSSSPAP